MKDRTQNSEEAQFQQGQYRQEKALNAVRLLCLLSVFAFGSFAAVDPFMVNSTLAPLYWTRFIVVIGSLLVYGISHVDRMKPFAFQFGAGICIWTGMGVVLVTELTGGASSL